MVNTLSHSDETILTVILQHDSVTDADVAKELPHTTAEQRARAFNSLLSSSRIQLVGSDFNNPRYRGFAKEEAVKVRGLSAEDMLVYQVRPFQTNFFFGSIHSTSAGLQCTKFTRRTR
jgi:hypothetical protein